VGELTSTRAGSSITLLLVLSPESVNSKYVKMEYRYFFKHDKAIVPILCKTVDIPFEIATFHYLDFTNLRSPDPYAELDRILSRKRNS
jgi:hypothetical protein